MKEQKKVIFCGTPKIASACLETLLLNKEVEIVAVICQPDRINSRHNEVIYNEVKQVCIAHNLKCLQYENINDHVEEIKSLNPDLILTCAYGQFIGDEILQIPKYKCINIHASLLPKLRGGAPIHWAIINGEKQTGISIMYMERKMDSGNIIYQQAIDIEDNDTYDSLYIKLMNLATMILKEKLLSFFIDNLSSVPQDNDQVTFGLNIKKEEEIVNFNKRAIDIYNQIRGLFSKPCAKIIFNHQKYKINECSILDHRSNQCPGTIIDLSKQLVIATADFDVSINKIQPPNKKWLTWKEFNNGKHEFVIGKIINNN